MQSCWSCVKQNAEKITVDLWGFIRALTLFHAWNEVHASLHCVLISQLSAHYTRAGGLLCMCNFVIMCERSMQLHFVTKFLCRFVVSASSLQFFSQTRRSNLRARSFISIYLSAFCVLSHAARLKSIILTMVYSFVLTVSQRLCTLELRVFRLHKRNQHFNALCDDW